MASHYQCWCVCHSTERWQSLLATFHYTDKRHCPSGAADNVPMTPDGSLLPCHSHFLFRRAIAVRVVVHVHLLKHTPSFTIRELYKIRSRSELLDTSRTPNCSHILPERLFQRDNCDHYTFLARHLGHFDNPAVFTRPFRHLLPRHTFSTSSTLFTVLSSWALR